MAIIDSSNWYKGNDQGWTNIQDTGGPVEAIYHHKKVTGVGTPINALGFWRTTGQTTSTNDIFQIDFKADKAVTGGLVALCGISLVTGLDSNSSVYIMFNTFLGSEIRLNDYGQSEVSGGTGVSTFTPGTKYTAKFLINANGTVTGYVNTPDGANVSLGTTTIANDLHDATVYFSAQQTFISPSSKATNWDNYYLHSDGLTFTPPNLPSGANLESYDWDMKENYRDNK